jgi:hypothetical protein
LQGILFCLYLKWQPWHTRLHTPLFFLSIPLICYAISLNKKFGNALYLIAPVIILYSFFLIIFNRTRPFLSNEYTANISITDNRYKKYFGDRLNLFEEYNTIRKSMISMNKGNIGLILGGDDWEYPLFCQFYGKEIYPVHIKVANFTENIPVKFCDISCIISTTLNDSLIDYNGKQYYNQNRKNKVIWLYK